MIKFLFGKILNRENIKYTLMLIIIILGIIIICIVKHINNSDNGLVINKIPMLDNLKEDGIGVYIDGEINKVGYIKLSKDSTLEHAINKAGGITKNADIQNLDFKRKLKNQEKIIIPRIKEKTVDEDIDDDSHKININTATKEELSSLEGIGEKTAENIIQYRDNNIFDTIEEIKKVKGIGEGKFEKIKENICT